MIAADPRSRMIYRITESDQNQPSCIQLFTNVPTKFAYRQSQRLDQGRAAKGMREVAGNDGTAIVLVQLDHHQRHFRFWK